jgi:DNA-binding GntR family transcriptional regulator
MKSSKNLSHKTQKKSGFRPVYVQLKKMILSGKLKKGQRLLQDGIAQDFNISKMAVTITLSQLKKDRLIISKRGVGSFVA